MRSMGGERAMGTDYLSPIFWLAQQIHKEEKSGIPEKKKKKRQGGQKEKQEPRINNDGFDHHHLVQMMTVMQLTQLCL